MHMLVITSVKSTSEKRNMKNLIFQYLILNENVDKQRGSVGEKKRSELYQEVADISKRSFEIYAKTLGCDHIFSTEPYISKGSTNSLDHFFECLRIIYDESYDQYDKILFLDCDVVCNTDKDIFQESNAEVYGVFESDIRTENGGGYNVWDLNPQSFQDHMEKWTAHDCPVIPILTPPHIPSRITMLNSGVLVWSKEARLKARERFDDWREWLYEGPQKSLPIMLDQPWINAQLMKHDIEVEGISQVWNDTPTHYSDHDKAFSSNFLHYTGGNNKLTLIEHYQEGFFKIFS